MAGFGFSVGDVIATAGRPQSSFRKLIRGLKATTGAAAQYQRTLIELESLKRVLRFVERLEVVKENDNASHINSLRAAAFATSLTLQDFLRKFQKYEEGLAATSRITRVQKAAKAVQYTLSMDEDVDRLQLYISGQLLSINTLLQLLEREAAHEREGKHDGQHQQISAKIDRQTITIGEIDQKMIPMTTHVSQSRRTVESLAKTSLRNTKILQDLHHYIAKTPSLTGDDTINFVDALGRPFALPYAFFDQWDLFEGFVKQRFAGIDIPGHPQVERGSFVISRDGFDSKAVTKANWASNIYPGASLNMTVVFAMLKVRLDGCPKPHCESNVSAGHRPGSFVTCPACGLKFRYDPNVQQLGFTPQDDNLRKMQGMEDLANYGQRTVPADVVEICSEDEQPLTPQSPGVDGPVDVVTSQSPQALSMRNLARLHETVGQAPQQVQQRDLEATTKLPSIDWNSGTSGMAAWLNSSALRSNDAVPDASDDTAKAEAEQLRQELRDAKALKRIHFTSTVPETQPLRDKVRDYQEMPLDVQVHVRKIVDRFPQLPAYLAKRFAVSNAARRSRLQKDFLDHDSDVEPEHTPVVARPQATSAPYGILAAS